MSTGFTPSGQQALGVLVRQCRFSDEVRNRVVAWMRQHSPVDPIPHHVSQEQFARWLTATSGIVVSESAIGRLERGEGQSGPPLQVLIALCEAKALQIEGEVLDLNRVCDVLCGES